MKAIVIEDKQWSVYDLKEMEKGMDSARYREAISSQIHDGLARRFRTELHRYKVIYEGDHNAAVGLLSIEVGR